MDCNNPLKAIPEWCVFPASLGPGRSIQACVPQWASFGPHLLILHILSLAASSARTGTKDGWRNCQSLPCLFLCLPYPCCFPLPRPLELRGAVSLRQPLCLRRSCCTVCQSAPDSPVPWRQHHRYDQGKFFGSICCAVHRRVVVHPLRVRGEGRPCRPLRWGLLGDASSAPRRAIHLSDVPRQVCATVSAYKNFMPPRCALLSSGC